MCTVTVVTHDTGVRLMCNRDERNDRPPAREPERYDVGGRTAVFPVDPAGGGSWIGVNDAGLAVALLNGPDPATSPRGISRGVIVTRLLECASLDAVTTTLRAIDLENYCSFQIVAVQSDDGRFAMAHRRRIVIRSLNLTAPQMATSSSVARTRARAARRTLFRGFMQREDVLSAQRDFHHHVWPGRPQISVTMTRPDARTVSRTWIDLGPRHIAITYEPLDAVSGTPVRHVRL